jgi:hypothetical protein
MNEQEFIQKLENIEKKLDDANERIVKIRKTQVTRFIISIILFFLPLIAIIFSVPFLLEYLQLYQDVL